MLDLILATLEIDSNLKEKEQLPRYSNAASNKDLSIPLNSKKRKTNSPKSKYSGSNSISFRQVFIFQIPSFHINPISFLAKMVLWSL